MNQCPLVLELYARVEGRRNPPFSEIHLHLSCFGWHSGRSFRGHYSVLFSPHCSNCSASLQISVQLCLLKGVIWLPLNHEHHFLSEDWRSPVCSLALCAWTSNIDVRCDGPVLCHPVATAVVPQHIFVVDVAHPQLLWLWYMYCYSSGYFMCDLGWEKER